jgi:hypothetical protein
MPWGEVTSYLPAIVTYQEWYPTALTLDLARQEVKHSNAEGFPFDLMSAEDIEWLLAWTRYEDPISVLQEMHNDVASKGLSVGQYVGVRAKGKGVTKIEKTPLSIKLA